MIFTWPLSHLTDVGSRSSVRPKLKAFVLDRIGEMIAGSQDIGLRKKTGMNQGCSR